MREKYYNGDYSERQKLSSHCLPVCTRRCSGDPWPPRRRGLSWSRRWCWRNHDRLSRLGPAMELLTNWFARKNVDDTIIFMQYLLLSLFRFVQLLTSLFHSNLEVCFTSAPNWPCGLDGLAGSYLAKVNIHSFISSERSPTFSSPLTSHYG